MDEVKLTVNRNTVHSTSAADRRLRRPDGTPAATMRGFDEEDFRRSDASSSRLSATEPRQLAGREERLAV